jgi:hypothetical protein
MRWFWIVLGPCAVGVIVTALVTLLGCGDIEPPPVDGDVMTTIVEEPIGPRIEPAPLPSNVRARVRQHPSRAPEACSNACLRAGGKMYKVGPSDTAYGWECLCSWEE